MFPSREEARKKDGRREQGKQEIPKTFTFYPSALLELKRKRSIILLSSHREIVQRRVLLRLIKRKQKCPAAPGQNVTNAN